MALFCDICEKYMDLDFESTILYNGTDYMHKECHHGHLRGLFSQKEEISMEVFSIIQYENHDPYGKRLLALIGEMQGLIKRIDDAKAYK